MASDTKFSGTVHAFRVNRDTDKGQTPEVVRLVQGEVEIQPTLSEAMKGNSNAAINSSSDATAVLSTKQDRGQTYLLARIKRDAPEIADEYLAGGISSVRAAAIKAVKRLYELNGLDGVKGGRPANRATVAQLAENQNKTERTFKRMRTLADLIPPLATLLDRGEITQAVAYQIAQLDAEGQKAMESWMGGPVKCANGTDSQNQGTPTVHVGTGWDK